MSLPTAKDDASSTLPPPDSAAGVNAWYLASTAPEDGVIWRGPFLQAEMEQMIAAGLVTSTDRVWHPSFPAWTEVARVPALGGAFAQAAPVVSTMALGIASAADSPPPKVRQRPRFPTDRLPLSVLGVICICFALHFASRLPLRSVSVASLPAKPSRALDGAAYDLEICNQVGNERVYVTVAYYDPLRRDWMARGWFPQKPGECQLTMRRLTPPVFVYAETADGEKRWGDEGDGTEFCIDRQRAFVVGQSPCRSQREAPLQKFSELPLTVGTDGVKRFRWEIDR